MNSARWAVLNAMGVLLLASASAGAQDHVDDLFGELEAAAPQAEAAPGGENSLLSDDNPFAARAGGDLCQCVGETNSVTVAKIEHALDSPLRSAGLEFVDAPLEQVVNILQDEYEIPIQMDTTSMDEIGVSADEPISIHIRGVSLRSALRLMLKQRQLTFGIQDEVLMITTPEAAESELLTCVYDVRDIAGKARIPAPMGASTSADFDSLIDVITTCIATETWKENGGGQADIRPLRPGLLVIAQTRAVHDEIKALLETIRTMQNKPPSAQANGEESAAGGPRPNEVVTRSYYLQIGQGAASDSVRKQISELITRSLPDEQFQRRLDDGQAVVLTILPDRVVLRHTPAVQQRVEALLTDSGLAAPPQATAGMGGFGGRGGGLGGGGFGGGAGGGFFQPRANQND